MVISVSPLAALIILLRQAANRSTSRLPSRRARPTGLALLLRLAKDLQIADRLRPVDRAISAGCIFFSKCMTRTRRRSSRDIRGGRDARVLGIATGKHPDSTLLFDSATSPLRLRQTILKERPANKHRTVCLDATSIVPKSTPIYYSAALRAHMQHKPATTTRTPLYVSARQEAWCCVRAKICAKH